MSRNDENRIWIAILVMVILGIITGIAWACISYRKEPAIIKRMHWVRTRFIQEQRKSTRVWTDSKGYAHTSTESHWHTICSKTKSGNRSQLPEWPILRDPRWGERLRQQEDYIINAESKLDKTDFRYSTSNQSKWNQYHIGDEVLVGVSFSATVWSIDPLNLEN